MMYALPLPNGRIQIVDRTGAPIVGGKVYHYAPGGLTPKDTYQNYAATILNDNPVILDDIGSAAIWGIGRYRQIVLRADDTQVWDEETAVLTNQPYEAGFYWSTTPSPSTIICAWNFTQTVDFETNFVGAYGFAESPPSVATAFDIKIDATTPVGTLTYATDGSATFDSGLTPTWTPGQRLTIHTPVGGANGAAGMSATFLGVLRP
jgi:hypothetical protein